MSLRVREKSCPAKSHSEKSLCPTKGFLKKVPAPPCFPPVPTCDKHCLVPYKNHRNRRICACCFQARLKFFSYESDIVLGFDRLNSNTLHTLDSHDKTDSSTCVSTKWESQYQNIFRLNPNREQPSFFLAEQ